MHVWEKKNFALKHFHPMPLEKAKKFLLKYKQLFKIEIVK
jgi:hypothetical protein